MAPLARAMCVGTFVLLVAACAEEAAPTGPQINAARAKGPPTFVVQALPKWVPEVASVALDINNNNWIVGTSVESNSATGSAVNQRAVLWGKGYALRDLGNLGGTGYSSARSINDANLVTGRSTIAPDIQHAFAWSQSLGMVDVTTNWGSSGHTVTEAGTVVGAIYGITNSPIFLWSEAGGLTLPSIPEGFRIAANSWGMMNSDGEIVGQVVQSDNFKHAATWSPGGGLRILPDQGPGLPSTPYAINEAGYVAGMVWTCCVGSVSANSAALWSPDGELTLLPGLGGQGGRALAISNRGEVVGAASDATGKEHAVYWTPTYGTIALPPLAPGSRCQANGINDKGRIVGECTTNGLQEAVVWRMK